MNFQEFFRSFIGLNPRYYDRHRYGNNSSDDPVNKFRNPPWGDDPDEDDDFDELYSDYRSPPPGGFGFNMFTGDVMEMHKFFEQQMNDMMRTFNSIGVGTFDFGSGSNSLMDSESDDKRNDVDVRDRYLKAPVGKPRFAITDSKTDSDIDDRVTTDGVGALFRKEPALPSAAPRTAFSRSFTSRVIINNNGRVEERVKEWSSDGVEKEHVRRTLGDQTHSVTTSKDKTGQLQTEEQLINLQQDSLPDFDQKWSSSSRSSREPITSPQHPVISPGQEGSVGIFSPLLRLFS